MKRISNQGQVFTKEKRYPISNLYLYAYISSVQYYFRDIYRQKKNRNQQPTEYALARGFVVWSPGENASAGSQTKIGWENSNQE